MNPLFYVATAAALFAAYGAYRVIGAIKQLPTNTASTLFPPDKTQERAQPTAPAIPPPTAIVTPGDTAANVAGALGKILTAGAPILKTVADAISKSTSDTSSPGPIINDVAKDFVEVDFG